LFIQILSTTSRGLLTQFQKDLDDLGARMGATSFGRAETIDPLLFRNIKYANKSHLLYYS